MFANWKQVPKLQFPLTLKLYLKHRTVFKNTSLNFLLTCRLNKRLNKCSIKIDRHIYFIVAALQLLLNNDDSLAKNRSN